MAKAKSGAKKTIPVCGIGASAGGVQALQQFFAELPGDLGLAYVVVMHLPDDHPSLLDEILASATDMPVRKVDKATPLEADIVYVITPEQELTVEDDRLSARPHRDKRGHRAPIDLFFRSIADGRSDSLAVVLSGAGSDGAVGVRAVKEAGGLIFVQDPADAEFGSMPQNAIATGGADFVAPVAELASRIADMARNRTRINDIDEDHASDALRKILSVLGARTGHDFSSYKRATVLRRVRRRMHMCAVTSLSAYAELIENQPDEASELFGDLLISVTQFFRDADAFEALAEHVVAPLMADIPEEGLRAWSVGCATGEEVYSLAMVVLEQAEKHKVSAPIQIFATDLDEGALKVARAGRYPKSIEADVSPERLKRFFVSENNHYRIRKEVRDIVLFASHSVLKDPPFVRLDLIACRNLMIYMERQLQKKLCALFHYGLKPGGALFLGSAETCDSAPELFSAQARDSRIYRAKPGGRTAMPVLAQVRNGFREEPAAEAAPGPRPRSEPTAPSQLHAGALEAAAPPSVLIDEDQHIVHLSANAGRFLLHSGGPFSGRIGDVVRPELRLDLRYAVDRAFSSGAPVITAPAPVAFNGHHNRISLHVAKIADGDAHGAQALVVFLDGGRIEPDEGDTHHDEARPDETRRLHAELKAANEALVASRSEHETAIQDLRAANEELQSINEEYRSTSEELETSKEELQSMNEELQTVNAELKEKLKSISSAHDDLRNLTAATEIGTLFLDAKMRIRMFTPPVADLFNIEESDVGRALTDFTHQLDYDRLEADVRKVLRDLVPVETELRTKEGRWFMMRVRPYRTMEDRIDGAVVSFVEISRRREMERQLKESELRYRSLYNAMDQGYCVVELVRDGDGVVIDFCYLDANAALERQTGLQKVAGRLNSALLPDLEADWFAFFDQVSGKGEADRREGEISALGRHYEVFATPHGEAGPDQLAVLFNDITARKADETQRELLTRELSHRVKNTLAVVQSLAMMTGRSVSTVEAFRTKFIGRLQALGVAHDLLLQTQWRYAGMADIAQQSLAAYAEAGAERVTVDGENLPLSPKQGLGLAMVLHELATNAAKYGALSSRDGALSLGWEVTRNKTGAQISLVWREQGGPAVRAPQKPGFGATLIQRLASQDIGGTIELEYAEDGVRARLDFAQEPPAGPEPDSRS
ncbi:MAG: chemotaxis protein CheB [Oceanicaulis sp.]